MRLRLHGLLCALVGLVVLGLPVGASAQGSCPNEGLRELQGSTFLAECRGYEMVSPVEKNGGDVIGNSDLTRSARDGDAVTFASFAAFADAQGTRISVEYAAQRGPGGWGVHAITPPQDPFAQLAPPPQSQTQLVGELSDDLSTGLMIADKPLTAGAPNVASVPNLYLRRDILSGPPGQYQLLSDAASPLTPYHRSGPNIVPIGSSADFGRVFFESWKNLTPEAASSADEELEWKLYEWHNGSLRVAGVLPDGSLALGSGSLDGSLETHVSRDGSRIFFMTQEGHVFDVAPAGKIYTREGSSQAVQVNASELETPDPPKPAALSGVLPDGSQAFFLTEERLTEEDTNNVVDLYRYDVNAPAGHHLTLISKDSEPSDAALPFGVSGVLGVSEDGSYVYFHDRQRLLSGLPELRGFIDKQSHPSYLYVWHDGIIRLVSVDGEFEMPTSAPAADVTVNGVLVYASATPETSYDTAGSATAGCESDHASGTFHCVEVYVYDPQIGHVECASCDPSGAAPDGDALLNMREGTGAGGGTYFVRTAHWVTADGSRVFFDSPDALVPEDTNGKYDVYEYVVATNEVRLVSTGQSNRNSVFMEASADGSDVFFTTAQQLVAGDVDQSVDLYDARVGGGIAVQNEPPVAGCVGDECQGSLSAPPSFAGPASVVSGAGNLAAPVVKPAVKARKHKAKPKARKKKRHARRLGAKRSRVSHRIYSRRVGR